MFQSRFSRVTIGALALSVSVAACGGGGGGSSPVVPGGGGGGPTPHAALRAGFTSGGAHKSSRSRRPEALAGNLNPAADYLIADPYVALPPEVLVSTTAIAFYDPSTGTVPSPLPTVTWTQTGPATMLTANANPFTIPSVTVASEETVPMPHTTGAGTVVGNASNGDSVSIPYFVYNATGMDAGSAGIGLQQCVTFSATGAAPSGATGDLCITINPDGTTAIVAAHGAVMVAKSIDAVMSSDFATLGTSASTITSLSMVPNLGASTIIAHTAAGPLVKFQALTDEGTDNLAGKVLVWYGPYRVATGTTFDF